MMISLFERMEPILTIGNKKVDNEEERRQKGFLVFMGLLMSSGGILWGTLCLFNDLYIAASIPYIYCIITAVNFTYLYKTKNFNISKNIQIFISLILPFFFQFFLGGFVASGGNVLWSVLAVFGSFTLRDKRASVTWLLLFIYIMILSGIVDSEAKQFDPGLPESYSILFFVLNFCLTISIIFSLYYYFVSSEERLRITLENNIEELRHLQAQLIVSEKMASLGALVSGVAHEINTPLGVGLTGISQINHEIKKVESNYHKDSLTEDTLLDSIGTILRLTQTINDRLNNAVALVKSFKSISVDQHFEDKREFLLSKYVDDLILSLQGPIKSKNVTVTTDIDENIFLESYPGIFSQIFTNLILNSIKHGFEEEKENVIKLSVHIKDNIYINYEDNGCGVNEEIKKKMFDPFFTTKRGQGGSGLGMNIVYNLVTQKLDGTIDMIDISPHGLGFNISLGASHIRN